MEWGAGCGELLPGGQSIPEQGARIEFAGWPVKPPQSFRIVGSPFEHWCMRAGRRENRCLRMLWLWGLNAGRARG